MSDLVLVTEWLSISNGRERGRNMIFEQLQVILKNIRRGEAEENAGNTS